MRFFPLISGIISLVLIYLFAREMLGDRPGLLVLGIFAVTDSLIYFSSEAKQYSSDVMVALVLLLVGHNALVQKSDQNQFILLGILGTSSIFISFPSVFILSGIGIALFVDYFINHKGDRDRVIKISALFLLWALCLAALYFFSLQYIAENDYLVNSWKLNFMPMPPWHNLYWFRKATIDLLDDPVGLKVMPLNILLLIFGVLAVLKNKRLLSLILFIPLLATVTASGFEKYPFAVRFLLFTVPIFLILLMAGLERICLFISRFSRLAAYLFWVACALFLLYQPSKLALKNFREPVLVEHIKPVMSYLEDNVQTGDSLYIYYGAKYAYTYYTSIFSVSADNVVIGQPSRNKPEKYISEVAQFIGQDRFWILFSHHCRLCEINEDKYILDYLARVGNKVDQFSSSGSAAYLFDLSK